MEAYRKTLGTMGTVRRSDRSLALQLYQRGISVGVIENAFVLAASIGCLTRPADAPPLSTIRSVAYFLPVIEEVLGLRVNPDYFSNISATSSNAPRQPGRHSHPARFGGMRETKPHACGVDDIAWASTSTNKNHASARIWRLCIAIMFPVPVLSVG